MKRRVIVKGLPKAQSGLESKLHNLRAGLGFNANTMPWPIMAGKLSEPPLRTNDTLQPVPREEANVEAERGEVAAMPTKSGIPDTKKIGGKRHYEGGTPLNLPTDTFIFSDTAKMRIKDPMILAQFGFPEKKNGFTPAEIAKKYDTTPYKKILMDKNADMMQQKTAEIMISNYNLKLAKLALYQESMKGFPQGLPAIAMPYVESMQLDPEMFAQANPGGMTDDETSESDMMSKFGGDLHKAQVGDVGDFVKIPLEDKSSFYYPSDYVVPGSQEYSEAQTGDPYNREFRQFSPQLLGTEDYPHTFKEVTITSDRESPKLATPGFGSWYREYFPFNYNAAGDLDIPEPEEMLDKEKEFSKKYPNEYKWYVSALNSNNADQMRNTAKILETTNIPNSWSMFGWSDQDKLDDLASILKQRAEELSYKKGQPDNTEFNQISEAQNKLNKLKERYNNIIAKEPASSINRRAAEQELEKLKPYDKQLENMMSDSEFTNPYSDPIGEINNIYNSLYPAKKEKKIESSSSASKADSSKVTPTPAVDSTKIKEREALRQQLPSNTTPASKPAEKKKTYVTQKKSSSGPVKLKKKKIDRNKLIQKKKGGSISGTRTVIVRATPKQTFATGGSVGLPKAQTGKIIAPNPDVYPVEWVEDDSTTPSKYYLEWSDGTYTNEQDTPPTSDQQAETRKVIAESKPSKKVTPEDYARLKELYEKAKAQDPSASGLKVTKEAEEFQDLFHKLLPLEARRIIAKDPKPTAKCSGDESYYNLDCNKDGRFGKRTVQYMEALETIQKQEDPKTETTPGTTETKTEGTSTPLISEHLDESATRRYPPVPKTPFVQDVNNLNRAFLNYVGIQGFQPDLVQVPFQSPQLFFQSPERLLDENKSQMNIAANVLGKTRSPQDFYGGWSAIAGPGMTNAANIIANIHGQNINIANQEAAARSQAYGQNQGVNANFRKAFTDEVNAVKQNIYNSRLAGANEMTKAQNALITNMANKFNMNLLYPQFAVDEEGAAYFHDPRALKPEDQALSISDRYQKMLQSNPTEAKSEEGKKRLWEMTKIEHGIASSTYDDPLSEYERAKKKGITPFMQYPGNSSE